MVDPETTGWGYRLIKIFLVVLVIFGAIFIGKLIHDRMPTDLEGHRPQLERLEKAYRLRQRVLREYYEEKINSAPNEVLSVEYQQDQNQKLESAKNLYFSDREAILRGEHEVLDEHWSEELKELKNSEPEDERELE